MPVVDKLDYEIAAKVMVERQRQYNKYSDQKHTNEEWWWILQEELVEAKCKIECGYDSDEVIRELVECSAVIQTWVRDLVLEEKLLQSGLRAMEESKKEKEEKNE